MNASEQAKPNPVFATPQKLPQFIHHENLAMLLTYSKPLKLEQAAKRQPWRKI